MLRDVRTSIGQTWHPSGFGTDVPDPAGKTYHSHLRVIPPAASLPISDEVCDARSGDLAALLGNLRVQLADVLHINAPQGLRRSVPDCSNLSMYRVLAGRAIVTVAGQLFDADANTVILAPRGSAVMIMAAEGPAEPVNVIRLELITSLGHGECLFAAMNQPVSYCDATGFAEGRIDEVLEEFYASGLGSRSIIDALLTVLIIRTLRCLLTGHPTNDPFWLILTKPAIARVLNTVHRNPEVQYSTATLAEMAGMSAAQLIGIFRDVFQQSPTEYLKTIRLELAKSQLLGTSLPVKTVAGNAGFASRSHFSRTFRKTFGLDPTEFRQAAVAG